MELDDEYVGRQIRAAFSDRRADLLGHGYLPRMSNSCDPRVIHCDETPPVNEAEPSGCFVVFFERAA
jgi:hypothetical protein